jgi:hypothetical protein
MKEVNLRIDLDYKNHKIQIRHTDLFIDSKKCELYRYDTSILSNKQLVVTLFEKCIKEVESLPKSYFKGLTFPKLVSEVRKLIEIEESLLKLRRLNLDSKSNVMEKEEARVSSLIRKTLEAAKGSWSYAEAAVLNLVSSEYIGSVLDNWTLTMSFNPHKPDTKKMEDCCKEFLKFKFESYLSNEESEKLRSRVTKLLTETLKQVDSFNKLVELADKDLVNWGSHKFHAQAKKHNLNENYQVFHWLEEVKKKMIESGIKPVIKPVSKTQILRDQYENLTGIVTKDLKFTQDEYIKLFKSEGEKSHDAPSIILNHMMVESALSLLDSTNQNVITKLYHQNSYNLQKKDPKASLIAIGNLISKSVNPSGFNRYLKYFKDNHIRLELSWLLLFSQVDILTPNQFLEIYKESKNLGMIEIPEVFYNKILSKLPKKHKYSLGIPVSHAFLSKASEQEKSQILEEYRFNKSDMFYIDFSYSAKFFKNTPYSEIQSFISNVDEYVVKHSIETKSECEFFLMECAEHFFDHVVVNSDKVTARLIIKKFINRNNATLSTVEPLFSILDYQEKYDILLNSKKNWDIKSILTKEELELFQSHCINEEALCGYILNYSHMDLDQLVKKSKTKVYLPYSLSMAKKLSKASLKKVLFHGSFQNKFNSSSYYSGYEIEDAKTYIYSSFTREELDKSEIGDLSGPYFDDMLYLFDLMTESERVNAAEASKQFFRRHFENLPKTYLVKYKNQEAFKTVVGDRRNTVNDNIGHRLERILETIK